MKHSKISVEFVERQFDDGQFDWMKYDNKYNLMK